MADVFTVFAYDICTNTLICELPANDLSFDSRLNDAGAISFTINLLDPGAAAQVAPFMAYYTGRVPVALYVDRDGVLVWGGFQTTGNYTHTGHTLPVQGKEWLGWWAQRRCAAVYDGAAYPNGVDPAGLIYTAVTDAQNTNLCGPGAQVWVAVDGGNSTVPWTKPSYTRQSFVSQVIADCTAGVTPGTGGIDIWTEVAYASGLPQVTHHIESPRAGRAAGTTGFAIDLLEAVDFTWPVDYQTSCTHLFETGAGSGQVQPQIEVQAPGVPLGGLGQSPRMDKVISHSNTLDPNQLAHLANGEVREFSGGVTVPTVTLRTANPSTPLGTWIPGDDCRLIAAPFELAAGGIDEAWRVVQHAVTVPDDGVPTVTLTFNLPPQY